MCIFTWYVYPSSGSNRESNTTSACELGGETAKLTEEQIPKPNATEGLSMTWPMQPTDLDKLKSYFEEIKAKM